MKVIYSALKNLKLRTKLIISFIILISIPTFIIGFSFYNTGSEIISENIRKNIYEIVKKNTQISDIKLSKVEESAMMMVVDPDLYTLFESDVMKDESQLFRLDYDLTMIMSRYFSMHGDVYSAYIVTSGFSFGSNSRMFIPKGVFYNTSLYSYAVESKGKTRWIGTYDFTEMYDQNHLTKSNFDYRYMFSAVKLLNISTVENKAYYNVNSGSSIIKSLDIKAERPVLILNFQEDMFRDLYTNSLPVDEAVFLVIDKQGKEVTGGRGQ